MQCQFKNTNVRTYVESYDITQSVFMAFLCIFVSFSWNIETLHTMNAAIFILLLSMLAFYQHDFRLTDEWDWKQKQHGLPYFSFLLCHHFQFWVVGKHKEVNTTKGDMIGFPLGPSFTFQCHFLSGAWSKFQLKEKARPFRTVSAPTESGQPRHSSLGWGSPTSHRWRPLWNSVLMGHEGIKSQWAGHEGQTHILSTSPPLAHVILYPIGLHLVQVQDTSIKKFKVAAAEHETKLEPSKHGALWSWPCPSFISHPSFPGKPTAFFVSYVGVYLFIIMDSKGNAKECSKILLNGVLGVFFI